jgi:hypothetical protein
VAKEGVLVAQRGALSIAFSGLFLPAFRNRDWREVCDLNRRKICPRGALFFAASGFTGVYAHQFQPRKRPPGGDLETIMKETPVLLLLRSGPHAEFVGLFADEIFQHFIFSHEHG